MEQHEQPALLSPALALADSFAGASPLAVSLVKRMALVERPGEHQQAACDRGHNQQTAVGEAHPAMQHQPARRGRGRIIPCVA